MTNVHLGPGQGGVREVAQVSSTKFWNTNNVSYYVSF